MTFDRSWRSSRRSILHDSFSHDIQQELALITALNTWVLSVLTNGWFHADVHAGRRFITEFAEKYAEMRTDDVYARA